MSAEAERGLGRDSYLARPTERLPKSCEHRQIGVERDPLAPAHTQRCEAVAVLQVTERSLDGDSGQA